MNAMNQTGMQQDHSKLDPSTTGLVKSECTPKSIPGKPNTYAVTFEVMLDMLVYIVFSGRPITWRDIQENVHNKHKQTLIRQLKALEELGYLKAIKRLPDRVQIYAATEKGKQMFGVKSEDVKS